MPNADTTSSKTLSLLIGNERKKKHRLTIKFKFKAQI